MTRPVVSRLALTTLAAVLIAAPAGLTAREHVADPPQARPLTSLANLAQQARDRVSATPRVALDAVGQRAEPGLARGAGVRPRARRRCRRRSSRWPRCRTPCCSRARVAPEIKAAMGLRIAQVNGSPYVAAHMLRVLKGHDRGRRAAVRDGGQRRQPPVDVGAGGAALCRDPDAHRQPRAERVRARRRDVQRQRDRRADDDRQLLQLLHALHRGAEPAGRIVGAGRRR